MHADKRRALYYLFGGYKNNNDKIFHVSERQRLKGDMQRYLTKLTESYFQLLTTIQRRLHNRF